ncbi:NUDIX domain-containing protein [Paenibacillus sp. Marseille-Q4541]|uniref:NUDIX domain-containing protein n=1 Tax=Paenibacillus sp. Marseille-Q4541 TaxID=2831522 RepID=UPI001BAC485C|nr:NUDIX domain-containing protein [Paenibacillus sp. Marseille-Q4541]
MKVRCGVKAVIIKNNSLLTIKKHDDIFGADYTLPGGGQEFGETIIEALKREIIEEVGVDINVKHLLFLREYIGKNHHEDSIHADIHVVDHIFYCELIEEEQNDVRGTSPDEDQLGIEWIPLKKLSEYRFFPRALIPDIIGIADGNIPQGIYTGDIN